MSDAMLTAQVSELYDRWQTREDQLRAWLGGTATGGPNSDGTYPLTDAHGATYNVKCPARIVADFESPTSSSAASAASAESFAEAAAASATAAASAKTAAQTAQGIATTRRDEAATSATQAATSAAQAEAWATEATTGLDSIAAAVAAAEASAEAAADSAALSLTGGDNAAAAAASATAAAGSATAAAGSASTASAQAGLASGSASAAASSATAAAMSSSNASTSATNAAASATAAAGSLNSTRVAASALFPERMDSTASDFTGTFTGNAFTGPALPSANVVTESGYGFVYSLPANADFCPKGLAPASAGRIYEVEVEISCPTYAAAANFNLRMYGLNASFSSVGQVQAGLGAITATGVTTYRVRFGAVAEAGPTPAQNVTAWPANSIWLRPMLFFSGGAGSTIFVRRMTVRDVTAVVAAERNATSAFLRAVSLFPDRLNSTGTDFTTTTAGDERAGTALAANRILTEPDYGFVYSLTVGSDIYARGLAPAVAGRVYEVEAEFSVVVAGTSVTGRVGLVALSSTFTNLGAVYANVTTMSGVTTATGRWRFSNVAPSGGSAWSSGAVWLRPVAQYSSGVGATVYLRRLTVRDVTVVVAAETQAAAAAASAAAAATLPVATLASSRTLLTSESVVLCDTSGGNQTATLPSAVSVPNRRYTLVKTTAANTLVIATTSSQTIDGAAASAQNLTAQWSRFTVVSDGSNWIRID
ncbi:MAG: hypothetical protein ACOVT5_01905 [Armatimonadaceae bacterium]